MIYQIQQQKIDDLSTTELVAQGEPPEPVSQSFLSEWMNDVRTRHELPDGWQWLVCDEKSEYFKWAAIVAKELKESGVDLDQSTVDKMHQVEQTKTTNQ